MKILLALKPGESHTAALDRVQSICVSEPTDVLLYSSLFDDSLESSPALDSKVRQDIVENMCTAERSVLHTSEKAIKDVARQVSIEVEWVRKASLGVCAAAARFGADLIVITSPHHSAISRVFFRYNDLHIPLHTSIPVLLAVDMDHRPGQAVMAAVTMKPEDQGDDGLDKRIVSHARQLASAMGAEMHLAHAYPSLLTLQSTGFGDYLPPLEAFDRLQTSHHESLLRFANNMGIPSDHAHTDGNPTAQALSTISNKLNAGVLVIGLHSRSAIESMLIATTAESLLSHPPCDLLLCR